jgi:hypothetical protein
LGESGLYQRFAKPPLLARGATGSNPVPSAMVIDQLNEVISDKYFDDKYKELPSEVVGKAVRIFRDYFQTDPEAEKELKALIEEHGINNWQEAAPGFHFSGGMFMRNLLRKNGVIDDMVPDKNLDDYYMQLIEASLGFRDVLTFTLRAEK